MKNEDTGTISPVTRNFFLALVIFFAVAPFTLTSIDLSGLDILCRDQEQFIVGWTLFVTVIETGMAAIIAGFVELGLPNKLMEKVGAFVAAAVIFLAWFAWSTYCGSLVVVANGVTSVASDVSATQAPLPPILHYEPYAECSGECVRIQLTPDAQPIDIRSNRGVWYEAEYGPGAVDGVAQSINGTCFVWVESHKWSQHPRIKDATNIINAPTVSTCTPDP